MNSHRIVLLRRRDFSRPLRFLVLGGGLLLTPPALSAATPALVFTVNSAGDAGDAIPGDGLAHTGGTILRNGVPEPEVTLRSALKEADMTPALDEIRFNVPGAAVTIQPLGSIRGILGALHPVIIDGTTQPLDHIVIVDGSLAGVSDPAGRDMMGLELVGVGSTVRGLFITNFAFDGLRIRPTGGPTGGNVAEGNVFLRNGRHGVSITDSPNNLIGGTTEAAMNVIALNGGNGVRVEGPNASGNRIQGNRIGTNRTGTLDQSNLDDQIAIDRAPDTIIGSPDVGPAPAAPTGASNVIVGKRLGVNIQGPFTASARTRVNANFLGLDTVEATLAGGILVNGSLLTAGGNVITRVSGTEIQAFFQVNGTVDIRHNLLKADALEGVNLRFAEGREMTLLFEQNAILQARKGLVAEESIGGNFTWAALQNRVEADDEAFSLIFRGSGRKTFGGDWTATGGAAFNYRAALDASANATLRLEASVVGGSGGVTGTLESGLLFSYDAIGGSRRGGSGSGDRLTLGVGFTGRAVATYEDLEVSFSAEAGIWLENKTGFKPFLTAFFERTSAHDNVVGINLLGLLFRDSVVDCTFTNNRDAGLRVADGAEGRIAGSIFMGNGVGVLILDTATASLTGNTLAGNGTALVLSGSGLGTALASNSIFGNAGLGIDLGLNGVTPNDPGDTDVGPNNLQNFPLLTAARSGTGGTTIEGSLDSSPSRSFQLEFFANTVADPSGFGEGEIPLGTAPVTTDATGRVAFVITVPPVVAAGRFVSATATDATGGTSEFARSIQVSGTTPPPPPPPPPPPASLANLLAQVAAYAGLNAGQRNSLNAKLEAAQASIGRGKASAANQLNAFIHEVEALLRSGRLPTATANAWIAQARAILADL